MKAIILIGGMGTRLRPLTSETPKPLLPIANRPFLEYQFALLKKHGIKEIILCVAYLHHEFERYFGNGRKWGIKLRYVHETTPLGTGGAIRNASAYLDSSTVIFNGDILTAIDLSDMIRFHRKKKAMVSIALSRVKDPSMYGLVETKSDGRIRRFLEKPSLDEVTTNTINSGIYIFEPEAVAAIPEGVNYSVERGLFPALLERGRPLYGYAYDAYWLDIGTLDKYLQAHHDVMDGHTDFLVKPNGSIGDGRMRGLSIDGRLLYGGKVKIGEGSRFLGNVCIGKNVVLGRGVSIADSVLLDNTIVGDGVRIEGALIGKNCVIEENSSIRRGAAIGSRTVIRRYSRI